MSEQRKKVCIYTDGACSGNPGPGGWAAVLLHGKHEKRLCGYVEKTTNNQMELLAAVKGLESLNQPCDVTLYSDSAYLVNAFNLGWVNSWKKRGWQRGKKAVLKNRSLWIRLDELTSKHSVRFVKVKGHSDNKYNNLCDRLAVECIAKNTDGG